MRIHGTRCPKLDTFCAASSLFEDRPVGQLAENDASLFVSCPPRKRRRRRTSRCQTRGVSTPNPEPPPRAPQNGATEIFRSHLPTKTDNEMGACPTRYPTSDRARSMASARAAFARLSCVPRECLSWWVPSRGRASAAEDGAHLDVLRRAGANPPPHLTELIQVLTATGGVPLDPSDRHSVHPLVLPLARFEEATKEATSTSTSTVGLLVRPTDVRQGSDLFVVRSGPGGIKLLSPSAALHVQAALVEEDFLIAQGEFETSNETVQSTNRPVLHAAGVLGTTSKCVPGTFASMQNNSPKRRKEVFLQATFGAVFPDVCEALINHHEFVKKDSLSALVTSEWCTYQPTFRGWGFAHLKNAMMLKKYGRNDEARDAARVALACAPWWTLGTEQNLPMTLAEIAGLRDQILLNEWGASSFRDMLDTGGEAHKQAAEAMGAMRDVGIDSAKEKEADVTQFWSNEFEKKAAAVMDAVALQAAADKARSMPMSWDAIRPELGELYEQGGLPGFSEFVKGK